MKRSALFLLMCPFLLILPRNPMLAQSNAGVVQDLAAPSPISYEGLYEQLMNLSADELNVADVSALTLKRDVATFELRDGKLYLCKPINNRVCAAIYIGKGVFSMTPPTEIERQQVYRFYEKESLKEKFKILPPKKKKKKKKK